jgi:hypothetical protein
VAIRRSRTRTKVVSVSHTRPRASLTSQVCIRPSVGFPAPCTLFSARELGDSLELELDFIISSSIVHPRLANRSFTVIILVSRPWTFHGRFSDVKSDYICYSGTHLLRNIFFHLTISELLCTPLVLRFTLYVHHNGAGENGRTNELLRFSPGNGKT